MVAGENSDYPVIRIFHMVKSDRQVIIIIEALRAKSW